ncbi:protein arginine N-methyltransferase 1.6 isoform X2 [Malania oleifera]|uniref:protein arginine N-methyltransferase 1.6 isoform X2 n=1 Tax=Malania oleifera TaxID=397392 RepID=UPI0025AE7374|nr:protein arginine N-methyltransferase 1.6 isoform X2 [Malania oleifera]
MLTARPSSLTLRKATPLLRAMSYAPSERMFQLKLDPLTGTSEWVVIEEDEVSNTSSEPLLATTSYLDMLNDSRRNRAFRQAIYKTVTKPCHVLDIGAGTGLLSMMAARAMGFGDSNVSSSTEGMVTACESYLPMVKLMRKVLRRNGMERKIKVINKRSDDLKLGVDITSRADVLVSEILDSALLGEGLIPTLQHAHDMLLVENPQTVPYRATTYGQLVESTFLWNLHDLYNNEAKALDDIHLVPTCLETILRVKPQQYAMHCDAIRDIKLLSDPFKIFEFDFWKRPDNYGETELLVKTTSDGRVHALISWWILQLDSEGTIFYTTAPKWTSLPFNIGDLHTPLPSAGDWCDHWKQCVWFFPGKGLFVSKDEEVHLHAVHNDTSISYDLNTQSSRTEIGQCDFNAGDFHLTLLPERVAIYGDSEWRFSIFTAIQNALLGKAPSLCVVADDSLFLPILIAHLSKSAHVISLSPGLPEKASQYFQAVADANGYSMDQVKVLGRRKCLTLQDTHQKKVDLLIGEPFYCGNEGMLPWQNLQFWKERTVLDPFLSKDVSIMPCKGILKACAMSLPNLWQSRCCLKKIESFDHSVVNSTLGACGGLHASQMGPCLPFFIWQCGETKKLSEMYTIMEFDFLKLIGPCSGKAKVQFNNSGTCHGFVFWIDWMMDSKNSIVISTGPDKKYWKQGVKLVANPVAVAVHGSVSIGECCSAAVEASFDPSSGGLNVEYEFS